MLVATLWQPVAAHQLLCEELPRVVGFLEQDSSGHVLYERNELVPREVMLGLQKRVRYGGQAAGQSIATGC